MAWKNVIMMHFLNIWMKRLSCLECSKIIGFPYLYSNLKWRLIQFPTWEVLPTCGVPTHGRCWVLTYRRCGVTTQGGVECWRAGCVECRRAGCVDCRRGGCVECRRVGGVECRHVGGLECQQCVWLHFNWLLIDFNQIKL